MHIIHPFSISRPNYLGLHFTINEDNFTQKFVKFKEYRPVKKRHSDRGSVSVGSRNRYKPFLRNSARSLKTREPSECPEYSRLSLVGGLFDHARGESVNLPNRRQIYFEQRIRGIAVSRVRPDRSEAINDEWQTLTPITQLQLPFRS